MVTVDLEPQGSGRTLVRLSHIGWGNGEDWDRAFAYFDQAWKDIVLPRLEHRFKSGPVDWSNPPKTEKAYGSGSKNG